MTATALLAADPATARVERGDPRAVGWRRRDLGAGNQSGSSTEIGAVCGFGAGIARPCRNVRPDL
jgi:hypothetical protein